ncbi:hypothetical protein L210DRAFT_3529508 [Boletus edulis BED1]|uniref:Uncharacterized protein n=1 Tax=Boletus edulis BED1 TaxID=1328754 RepID=A0AAD4C2X2_BOLED|nr:hypothetical protein L210DRAFT_3529508 [Boletus edulis BED1]
MVSSPSSDPPISDLGFDPCLLSRIFAELSRQELVQESKPSLDQSFSAGIGNYLAGPHNSIQPRLIYFLSSFTFFRDQMKFYIRLKCIPSNDAIPDACQILALHHQIADVCRITVKVNADDTK